MKNILVDFPRDGFHAQTPEEPYTLTELCTRVVTYRYGQDGTRTALPAYRCCEVPQQLSTFCGGTWLGDVKNLLGRSAYTVPPSVRDRIWMFGAMLRQLRVGCNKGSVLCALRYSDLRRVFVKSDSETLSRGATLNSFLKHLGFKKIEEYTNPNSGNKVVTMSCMLIEEGTTTVRDFEGLCDSWLEKHHYVNNA